jgi:hypothetical protein
MVNIKYLIDINGKSERNYLLHPVHKFGYNPALAANVYETIWNVGGLYPWASWTGAAKAIFAKSAEASDTGELTVEGLDGNYNKVTETKTMTGQTAIQLSNTYKRITRASYTGSANDGVITLHIGSGTGTTVASIETNLGQTQLGVYTIPAGFTGYLINYTGSVGKNDDATLRMFTADGGVETEDFQVLSEIKLYESTFRQDLAFGACLKEKTDIDFRAITTSAGSELILNFELMLVDESREYIPN